MFARSGIPYGAHFNPDAHILHPQQHPQQQHGRHTEGATKPEGQNMIAAFFGLVVTGLFSVALAEPNWFQLNGVMCRGHLGMYPIFGFRVQHIPSKQGVLPSIFPLSLYVDSHLIT